MQHPPTMQDVANAAGVGKATVSLALRNDPRLRPETRERIQKIAAELGYHANAVVSNLMAQLRASRTPKYQATLGLVNSAIDPRLLETVPTFHAWVEGCHRRAAQLGYTIDDFWLHDPSVSPQRLRSILESRGIRGLIVAALGGNERLPAAFDVIWNHFATVVIGVPFTQPRLHSASNDQFETALIATSELLQRGFKRPALAISPEVDGIVDYRFSAGFWAVQKHLPAADRLPVFDFADSRQTVFAKWFERHSPDAILTLHVDVRRWLEALKQQIPQDVALVHLDWCPALNDWAGMNQNNEVVGAAAVDVVVGQLHRNESGVPSIPMSVLVESSWVDGATVGAGGRERKPQPASRSRPTAASGTEKRARRETRARGQ